MPAPLSAIPRSKLEVVYLSIKQEIEKGDWKVGDRIPTEIELARIFNCGRSTVGGAISRLVHDGLVERRTRAGTRVIRASFEPGAAVPAASLGARVKLDAFAFIYSSELHGGIFRMVQGFQLEARRQGRRVMNLTTGTDHRKEAEFIGRLAEFDVKGAVFNPLADTVEEELFFSKAIHLSKLPIMVTGVDLAGSNCPTVLVDDFHAGYTMARHLIDKGIRNIGFLANGSLCSYVRSRYQGYRWALKEAGITVSPSYVLLDEARHVNFEDPFAEPIGLSRRYLAGVGPGMEAVVCADDFLAVGLIQAALDEGFSIPGDLKIVGVGDDTLRPPGGVTLTTYCVPYEDIGRESFRLLDATFNAKSGGPKPPSVLMDGHLIFGSSTG